MSVSLDNVKAYFEEVRQKTPTVAERFDVEKARAISMAYCLVYANDGITCRGIEVPFTLPVLNPDTGEETGQTYSGIIDRFVQDSEGHLYAGDYKTASRVDQTYWNNLKTDPQLSQYSLGCRQEDIQLDGFMWDVLVKPSIKPKKLTKAAKAELENGDYCGFAFAPGYHGEDDETPLMYGQRVFVECTEKSDKYFFRRILKRVDEDLLEFMEDLHSVTNHASTMEKDGTFYRALSACKRFGSMCPYHAICSGEDRGRGTYVERKSPKDRPTGKGSFSPSRIACFNRCPKEYQYKYVEKIEPRKQEYSESLAIGSLLHNSLEIWMKSRLKDPITFSGENE